MKRLLSFVFLFNILILTALHAQVPAIGQWRTHLPYQKVIDVAVAGNIVYAATPYSLFTYNTHDDQLAPFGRVKGLNDVGISKIAYDPQEQLLMVAYTDANIDLIDNKGNVANIPDIYNKAMLGVKTINNIYFDGNLAYLSCSFGIVVVDLSKQEIKDTYYIGDNGSAMKVMDFTANDTSFFAATTKGIFYANRSASNLADFHQWHQDMRFSHPDQTFNLVTAFAGKVYANYYSGSWNGDTLYVFNGKTWNYFEPLNHERHSQLNAESNELLLVNRYSVNAYDANGKNILHIDNPLGSGFEPLAAQGEVNSSIWIGTNARGLLESSNQGANDQFFEPNGPGTTNVFDLNAAGNNVWVVPGGYQSDWSKAYIHDGVFSFVDGQWKTFDPSNTPAFDTISDWVCVKVDPANPEVAYVGTWQTGVLKFENNKLTTIYSRDNSSLEPWVANTSLVNISGMDFDSQHDLWVANSGAYDLLSVLESNGHWKSFNLGSSLSGIDIGKLMVDQNNDVWIIKRNNGMLIVYSFNGTPDDPSDDQVKVLGSGTGNGNLPGSGVYSMATDKNGEVWVGTDAGVAVFYNPANIFTSGSDFDAQQILVPRNDGSGLADLLLASETVTAITVDGANRKWIGTKRSGVFLLSADGLKQIYHFTTANSPLLSDNITGITIDKDGEVFIGTDKGLISFRGTATEGQGTNSDVYAFPNPVRQNYTGPIAIKGLVTDADVKITDSYGNLVYETKASGGQAIWYGNNLDNRRVSTGVYMVFITNSDGSQTQVTKILVIH